MTPNGGGPCTTIGPRCFGHATMRAPRACRLGRPHAAPWRMRVPCLSHMGALVTHMMDRVAVPVRVCAEPIAIESGRLAIFVGSGVWGSLITCTGHALDSLRMGAVHMIR